MLQEELPGKADPPEASSSPGYQCTLSFDGRICTALYSLQSIFTDTIFFR